MNYCRYPRADEHADKNEAKGSSSFHSKSKKVSKIMHSSETIQLWVLTNNHKAEQVEPVLAVCPPKKKAEITSKMQNQRQNRKHRNKLKRLQISKQATLDKGILWGNVQHRLCGITVTRSQPVARWRPALHCVRVCRLCQKTM